MKDNTHPNAQLALQTRERQVRDRVEKTARLLKLTETHHLRFVHVRNEVEGTVDGVSFIGKLPKGGATVAFQFCTTLKKGRRIKVAVALTHPNDSYSKKDGRLYAAEHFDMGECIKLQVPKGMGPAAFLKNTFYYAAQR